MLKKQILFSILLGLTTTFVAPSVNALAVENKTVSTATTQNGWVQSGSNWYYYINGQKHTGWIKPGNVWYYMNKDGIMQTGWLQENGKWYYLDSNGAMKTGWVQVSSKWYYMNTDGVMQTGWQKVNNTWYYLNSDGSMKTGWLQEGSKWYYLKSSGAMASGEVVEGKYYIDKNGVWVTSKKTLSVTSTAYSGGGLTFTGRPVCYNPNGISTISVDPGTIPLGSLVYVQGYGVAIAADIGGAIKGNKIDVYFNSSATAKQWGIKYGVKVDILAHPGQW